MAGKDSLVAGSATLVFSLLFLATAVGRLDFWWGMSAAVTLIAGLSLVVDRTYHAVLEADWRTGPLKKFLWGGLTAAILYAVFLGLNALARIMLPLAATDIARVYSLKAGTSPVKIGLLILLLIGPGEELIWRGYLQRHWEKRWGFPAGWLLATALYAAVHIGSGNAMLILAAGAAGLYWGFLYHLAGSTLLNAVSHTLWDLLVFLAIPLSP